MIALAAEDLALSLTALPDEMGLFPRSSLI
jgi:hypothetical protein